MATTYASPGVYVEVVDRGTKPIEAAGTSMTAFVGISAEASRKTINPDTGERTVAESLLNRATLITSWTQYTDIFGEFVEGAYMPDAVYAYYNNGGGPCYVVSLRAVNETDEPAPAKPASTKKDGDSAAKPAPKSKSSGDSTLSVNDVVGNAAERTGLGGLEALDDVKIVTCPDIFYGYTGSKTDKDRVKGIQTAMIDHCENMGYRFALLDTPPGLNAQQAKEWREFVNFDTSYAALYYPWVKIPNLSGEGSTTKMVPPSGAMAGIYNRSDGERGVHKVPANEIVRGAIDLELQLSKGEQDVLNPIGVNCIRPFPGRGIRVWGGRTLSSDGSWRYINVRRLFNMVGDSLDTGLQWVVFEPNDSALWAKVRRDITSFLRVVWRSGALFGTTPDQAFYVKCDEELNPPEIRDLGQLIIEVGMAPVKPAEFVILRLSQWAGADAEA